MCILSLFIQFVTLACICGTQYKVHVGFCKKAPNPSLQIICSQLHNWNAIVRQQHSSMMTSSAMWSSWSSEKTWSSSQSGWSSWTSWTTTYSSHVPLQRTVLKYSIPMRNISYSKSFLTPPSSSKNFSFIAPTPKEPKRMAFDIQYEISSEPNHSLQTGLRGGQVKYVKTHSRTTSLSTVSEKGKQSFTQSESFFHPLSTGMLEPPRSEMNGKDLYSMEQDMVGPPGQRRPNNLLRKKSESTAKQSFSSPEIHQISSSKLTSQSVKPTVDLFHKSTVQRKPTSMDILTPRPNNLLSHDRKNALECKELNCLCPFYHGSLTTMGCILPNGKLLSIAVRKEYRQLSVDERERFHNALERLKQSGDYEEIAQWHAKPELSGGAHSGPAFLPWHREYIKRFEIALRLIDPEVSLPYWDSTLDGLIPESEDTVMFSKELMGENSKDGIILNGFLSRWITYEGRRLTRQLGQQGRPLNEDDIEAVMKQSDITGVLAYTAPQQGCTYQTDWTSIEYVQANVFIWVGGDMFQQITSTNDPLFFLHHAFVDSIWELWRQHRQSFDARSKAYPPDLPECSSEDHFAQTFMRPFEPLRNIDGISNDYTGKMYRYAPRPTCFKGRDEECGSEFLFCDYSHGHPRCSTKIRLGGNCSGYVRNENPCYDGVCISRKCTKSKTEKDLTRRTISTGGNVLLENVVLAEPSTKLAPSTTSTSSSSSSSSTTTTIKKQNEIQCYDAHECCPFWASKGECQKNEKNMMDWCPASCHKCIPSYNVTSGCSDQHPHCVVWADKGECQANIFWMAQNCRWSCHRCHVLRSNVCHL